MAAHSFENHCGNSADVGGHHGQPGCERPENGKREHLGCELQRGMAVQVERCVEVIEIIPEAEELHRAENAKLTGLGLERSVQLSITDNNEERLRKVTQHLGGRFQEHPVSFERDQSGDVSDHDRRGSHAERRAKTPPGLVAAVTRGRLDPNRNGGHARGRNPVLLQEDLPARLGIGNEVIGQPPVADPVGQVMLDRVSAVHPRHVVHPGPRRGKGCSRAVIVGVAVDDLDASLPHRRAQLARDMEDPSHALVVERKRGDAPCRTLAKQQMIGERRDPEVVPPGAKMRGQDEDVVLPSGEDVRGIGQQDLHVAEAVPSDVVPSKIVSVRETSNARFRT